jgi:hypothetical protein
MERRNVLRVAALAPVTVAVADGLAASMRATDVHRA